MRDPDLTTLRLFAAVCEAGSIARAAHEHHLVASAVSKRLAALEHAYGTALLERRRRGVAPTAAGQALLEHVRSLLFTLDRARADLAGFAGGVSGHVRILASASAIAEALLHDVATFLRDPAHRAVKIDIEERVSGDIVRGVREGVAPIGVCWDSAEREGLQALPYRRDRLALAVPRGHALARRRAVPYAQTLAYEHVALPPATAVHQLLRRAAAQAGQPFVCRIVVSNFDAALRVVAAGLAVSVIPIEVGAAYAKWLDVAMVPLSDRWARRRFVIVARDLDSLTAPARGLVEHLSRAGARDGG